MGEMELIVGTAMAVGSIAFGAVAVLLLVRAVNGRRWARWALPAWILGIPALYIASLGPVVWLTDRGYIKEDSDIDKACDVYVAPAELACEFGPKPIGEAIFWYADLFSADILDDDSASPRQESTTPVRELDSREPAAAR